RLADTYRVRQHRREYRLQVARRTGDYAQHLGGRGLLLQGLGELLFQVGVGCAKAVNVSSRPRCLRTKTGNASSALRPFANQGHLVGTLGGPMLVTPNLIRSPRRRGRAVWAVRRDRAPWRS